MSCSPIPKRDDLFPIVGDEISHHLDSIVIGGGDSTQVVN
jgi:hypothetical protein